MATSRLGLGGYSAWGRGSWAAETLTVFPLHLKTHIELSHGTLLV